MHRNFPNTIINDPPIDSTQLRASLYSPFSYAIAVGEPNMIKQAAPQHPHGLTKLQHRLLYESDSESSFDLSFSSPSSIGSNSEYSDVGYQSSAKSRSRSSGLSRHAGTHSSGSRSGSISSVLGSSMAIQRVLMGSTHPSRTSAQSQRQSVRSIASAFEAASRAGTMRAPPKAGSQLERVEEQSVSKEQGSRQSTSGSVTSNRSVDGSVMRPARLKISKQPIKGPASAPVVSELPHSISRTDGQPTETDSHFVFPPRTPLQKRWPYDRSDARIRSFSSLDGQPDENEPAFDIVPSPSLKRSEPLPRASVEPAQYAHDTPRASLSRSPSTFDSDPLSSSRSAASRDSMVSSYSFDSLSGHPFSLQLPGEDELDLPPSSTASIHANDLDTFRSAFSSHGGDNVESITPPSASEAKIEHAGQHIQPTTAAQETETSVPSTSAASLQPLLLSTSRPSSSSSSKSTTTLKSSVPPQATMRVNEDTSFPMPPSTAGTAKRSIRSDVDAVVAAKMESQSLRDTSQATEVVELKRQAAELLASIRSVADEIDSSIPPTHRLPGSAFKRSHLNSSDSSRTTSSSSTASTTSFVAVDETYSDIWRLMDRWYWSSFEVGPKQSLD